MKPVSFIGNSLDALRPCPDSARREAGFQIDRL
jgi:phage-related protein